MANKLTAGECVKLLPQPASPGGKIVVLQCKGGSDKRADGHRGDTIPICNGIIKLGWYAAPMYYTDATADAVEKELMTCDGVIVRVNPGGYEGVTQSKLDALIKKVDSKGCTAMSHPDAMIKMGAKDALCKINGLSCGLPDTYAYYTIASLYETFPKSIALGHTRVLKQNRGSQGEGIWVVKVCGEKMDGTPLKVTMDTKLDLQEAVDNHKEVKTVGEFLKFCEQYIIGENGQLVDQRFLPRIVEGEIRVNMIYNEPVEIIHKKPAEGGISATLASGAKYVSYAPDDPEFVHLMGKFKADLKEIMPALGMASTPLPLIWTSDFILGPKEAGHDTYFVGEFNCSCVGITQQLHLVDKVAKAAILVASGKAGGSSSSSWGSYLFYGAFAAAVASIAIHRYS